MYHMKVNMSSIVLTHMIAPHRPVVSSLGSYTTSGFEEQLTDSGDVRVVYNRTLYFQMS